MRIREDFNDFTRVVVFVVIVVVNDDGGSPKRPKIPRSVLRTEFPFHRARGRAATITLAYYHWLVVARGSYSDCFALAVTTFHEIAVIKLLTNGD